MLKFVAIVIVSFFGMCDNAPREKVEVPKVDINTAFDRHASKLLALPGVTGAFVSELEDKTPCILVLVAENSEELNRLIPDSLEGYPVKIDVSGEFRPMGGQSLPR